MNKQIERLIEQATTRIDPSAHDGVCWDFDKEKFANLIVQECADIVDNHGRWILYDKLALKIKQHFKG